MVSFTNRLIAFDNINESEFSILEVKFKSNIKQNGII